MIKLLMIGLTLMLMPVNKKEQDKEYTAKATISEWQILLAHPDDVPKNSRDKVIAKFVAQLQQQVNADTIPKKK